MAELPVYVQVLAKQVSTVRECVDPDYRNRMQVNRATERIVLNFEKQIFKADPVPFVYKTETPECKACDDLARPKNDDSVEKPS